ncbi:MAG: hypothetical protein OEV44_13680 [Spirochaetota bacterium]|nr:hypothetical protein [Spirochaetota bacterium]
MFKYIFLRFVLIFIVVLVLLTAGFTIFYKVFDVSTSSIHITIINLLVYLLPQAIASSFLIFYSAFLFKKDQGNFNKNLSNQFSLNSFKTFLFLFLIGIIPLGLNFYFQEYFIHTSNIETNLNHFKPSDKAKKANVNKLISQDMESIAVNVHLSRYQTALEIIEKKLSNGTENFLYVYLTKIISDFKDNDIKIFTRAKKLIPNFEKTYRFFQNNEYDEIIKSLNNLKYPRNTEKYKIVNYFKDKALRNSINKTSKNIKYNIIEILITIGKYGLENKTSSPEGFLSYLRVLNRVYPNNSLITKELKKHKIDTVFLGEVNKIKQFKTHGSPQPLMQKLYFINSNPVLAIENTNISLGKTLFFIGEAFVIDEMVYFKDIIILAKIDQTNKNNYPAYFVPFARLERNRILLSELRNLFSTKNKSYSPNFIPTNIKNGYLKLSEVYGIDELINNNKLIKFSSKLTLFELIKINDEIASNLPLVTFYRAERLSYYESNFAMFLIFIILGFIFRTKQEKIPSWFIRITLSLFLIGFTFFFYYLTKQGFLLLHI